MAIEQPILEENYRAPNFMGLGSTMIETSHGDTNNISTNDVSHRLESFGMLERGCLPNNNSADEKRLSWLQSQIVGVDAEFDSPFGRRRLTYADHMASGRSLHYIENFVINNVLPFYGNTHTCDSYVGRRMTKMVHKATEYIKKCLGGSTDDAILFCGSGTTAAIKRLQEVMGIAVPSTLRDRFLKCLSNEERWVVFVGPYEHHSNLLSWRQTLAELVEIGLDENGLFDIEALREQLELYQNCNRPMLGSFSACSNVTGIYTDTRAIARLLHEYGGFACFDFAASGPYVEIDLKSGEVDGYDAVFISPHKFLGGPGSPGILLMSKALYLLKSSPPSTCGGGTVSYVNGFNEKDTLYLDGIEERENGGTPPIIQIIRAALAFWVKDYIGYEVIEKQEHIYIERALKRLLPNKNIWILGNTIAKRQAVLSFLVYSTSNTSSNGETSGCSVNSRDKSEEGLYLWRETGSNTGKPLHGPFVAALLSDLFGIQARGGCACAGPYGHRLLDVDDTMSLTIRSTVKKGYLGIKPGWARVSFPYYMSNEEFEFVLNALEFIATYAQRFLTLYHFNLKTGNWKLKKRAYKDLVAPLAGAFEEIGVEQGNSRQPAKTNHSEIIKKNSQYMETAKQIANLLPKFPPQRRLPEDIDPDILLFRV